MMPYLVEMRAIPGAMKILFFKPFHFYLWSIVSAHPSTAISCVAARKLRQKKQNVRSAMFGA
jgi:hypothetical protein